MAVFLLPLGCTLLLVFFLAFCTPFFRWLAGASILGSLLLFVLLLASFGLLYLVISGWINRPFTKENNQITRTYEKGKDAEQLLRSLSNMKHKPRSPLASFTLHMSLSSALCELGRYDESLTYLEKADAAAAAEKDKKLAEAVQQQRKTVLEKQQALQVKK
ncbi:MAG: hypothetical protein PHU79_00995 [Oscillospiraceae bacterium]|nr:hypothetical protein [Oscillospiraceae bacterium]